MGGEGGDADVLILRDHPAGSAMAAARRGPGHLELDRTS